MVVHVDVAEFVKDGHDGWISTAQDLDIVVIPGQRG